jgi:hypothetical protein
MWIGLDLHRPSMLSWFGQVAHATLVITDENRRPILAYPVDPGMGCSLGAVV